MGEHLLSTEVTVLDARSRVRNGIQGMAFLWEKVLPFNIMAGVVCSGVSIFVSDLFFGSAILFWLLHCASERRLHLRLPPFTPFLMAFFVACLVSIAFSSDVATSATYLKKFLKFLYIFFVYTYLSPAQTHRVLRMLFWVMGASAALGVVQYFWILEVHLMNRITGFMSHWMTFSGQLMLCAVALAAYLLCYRVPALFAPGTGREGEAHGSGPRWVAHPTLRVVGLFAILGLFLFALVLAQTRSTWLGVIGGLFVVLALTRPRWLSVAALLLGLLFVLFPEDFKQRLYSGFDTTDTTTRIRLELLTTGKNIVVSHPWTGLGPRMIRHRYQAYNTTDEFPKEIYQHLHNNLVQIGAEMGLITLLIWLAVWGRLLWDLFRLSRRTNGDHYLYAISFAGMGVVTAFLLAGLFEYNFGDSEILILIFFFITIPYVGQRGRKETA